MKHMTNKELKKEWKRLTFLERLRVSSYINKKAAGLHPISYISGYVVGIAGLAYTVDRFMKADAIKDKNERRREKIACWMVGIGAGALAVAAAIPYLEEVNNLAVEYIQKKKEA